MVKLTESDEKGLKSFYEDLAYEKNRNKTFNYTIDNLQLPKGLPNPVSSLETFDDLKERDTQREKDGFGRKLKIGKFAKPGDSEGSVIIIPSVEEEKLIHGDVDPDAPGSTTGQGDGEEGEKVGEEPVEEADDGEGDDSGAGEGSGGEHEVDQEAFEVGKTLTEEYDLPNLQNKGKGAIPYFTHDLVSKNQGTGQILDKKSTLKNVLKTNLSLIKKENPKIEDLDFSNLLISPKDKVFKTFATEKHYQTQAVVFFIRDYSASMHGEPTKSVVSQHVMIYSWLMYQYGNRVIPRFILHDTDAKEVDSFQTYYASKIAGGTVIASAYELVNVIIEDENLKNYEIYIFQGTDGDDWPQGKEKIIEEIKTSIGYCNRIGITVVKNSFLDKWQDTPFEDNLKQSGLLLEYDNLLKMDSMDVKEANEQRLIDGIKKLVSEE